MRLQKKEKCLKYSTVIGAMLLIFADGLYWYWGNMSVYTFSYYVSVKNVTSGVDTPWIISAFLVCWTIGTSVSGFISKRIGRRMTVLVGSVIVNLGVATSYYAVQTSIMSLIFSMGMAMGLGSGLSDSSVLQIVIEWADDDAGALTSLVQGSMSLGGFIINQLITLYTNPRNLTPDLMLGGSKYFTQQEVLENVPSMFLIVFGISGSSQLIGFIMLRRREKDKALPSNASSVTSSGESSPEREATKEEIQPVLDKTSKHKSIQCSSRYHSNDYSPIDMLKSFPFYAFWITSFLGDMAFLVLTNYYKIFGLIWIKNDHFLTTLGTAFVLANALMSLLWGVAMDRYGVKNCFIVNMACSAIVQVWFYFGPMTSQWLYAVETVLLGCFGGALISCYTAAIALVYGKKHFTNNYGIFMTSTLAFNLIAPSLMENIVHRVGWFSLFAITAGCNVVRLVVLMIFIPIV